MKPLRGGLKLDGKKEATTVPWTIARPDPPRRVRIPLGEDHDGRSFTPLVQMGDRVRLGQKLAEPRGNGSVAIHASVSGEVAKIGTFPHPFLGESEAIEIVSDGKDERIPEIGRERPRWESLGPSETIKILGESGVAQLDPLLRSPVDTVILNGCESEPYLTSGYSLMMSHPMEILKGGEILRQALRAQECIIALEDNKEEVAELLKSKIFLHSRANIRVEVPPARYPQEEESLLIRELLGRHLTRGRLGAEVGVAVFNVAEAFAAYEAVALQKPFYERAVTIGGECVAQPQNVWLRIGTLVEDAVKCARGFLRPPEKVILGGPMKGFAIDTLEVPLLKETPGILGLPREVARPETIEPCIRCGRCVESCPVFISPAMITLAAEKELFDLAEEHGASLCIECGNCSYVCPAKRPMVELIQYANAH